MPDRREAFHRPLTLPGRLVRVLGAAEIISARGGLVQLQCIRSEHPGDEPRQGVGRMGIVLLAVPRSFGLPIDLAGMADLLVLRDPDPGVWAQLAADISDGVVRAAELVDDSDFDGSGSSMHEPGTLRLARSYERLAADLINAGWASVFGDGGEFVLSPPRRAPIREVTSEEFVELIDTTEPVSTPVDPVEVELADENLFGVFASNRLGGSSALLAMSGADRDSNLVALRNPAALGLERVDDNPWSISASPVSCSALGLSSGDEYDHSAWDGVADWETLSQLWATHDHRRSAYWLMVELNAVEIDPPVWLPAGQVFEQTAFTGRQTLATTAETVTLVSPQSRSTLLLPAYCLDSHLGSPTSDPMRATPLRSPLPRGSMQGQVWRQRVAARGGAL